MTIGELRSLQDRAAQEIKARQDQEVAKAREQILAIAPNVGIPPQPQWIKGWVDEGKSLDQLRVS